MKMRIVLAALVMLGLAGHALADDRIVAVVNDQVITLNQLHARVALNLRQLGMDKPTDAQTSAVTKRTLSGLVDEELQRQYANGVKLKLTPEDISAAKEKAIAGVGGEATWANLTKGYEQSANDKLAAEALWQKIIAHDVQPRVQVSTMEADQLITELAKSRHVQNREISVIQLSSGSDGSGDKEQLNKLSELKAKLDKGEKFEDLAKAYSEDKSAVSGGNLGWFSSGELNPQLEEALDKMQAGQVSDPIRTPMGWYLVKLDDVRAVKPVDTGPETQIQLYLLAATAPSDTKVLKALNAKLDNATSKMTKPFEVQAYFDKAGYTDDFAASKALGWIVQGDLEPDLAKALDGIKPGHWSGSVTVNDTIARVYLADTKQVMPEKLGAYRERVMNSLFGNRVELEARRFMQNLRQRAFLDVRL